MPFKALRSFVSQTIGKWGGYSVLSNYGSWFYSSTSTAGAQVNQATALTSSAVWSAVRHISEGVSSLPLILYKKGADGARVCADFHPLYLILKDRANPEMSSMIFRETLMGHVLTWGNGYAEIERDPDTGRVVALWPLRPDIMEPVRDKNGDLFYRYGSLIFLPEEIFHIKGLGFDGVKGYSVVAQARDAIGLGMALENFGSTFFGNGAKPAGVISVPGKLSAEALQNMRKSWEDMHSSQRNAHRVAILQNGVTFQSIGTDPDDSQWLISRGFQIQEIARWFKIPSSKLGDNANKTYSSLEQDNLAFLQETLRPWMVRWEQEIQHKLISDMDSMYCEHNSDALLRGDSAGRASYYAQALNWGWLSRNDVRVLENLPSTGPAGDAYMTPKNMDPAFGPGQSAVSVDAAQMQTQLPTSSTDAPTVAPAAGGATVAATALNGAQITSLVDLVAKVGEGAIPMESAKAIALASFPFLDQTILDSIFSGLKPVAPLASPAVDQSKTLGKMPYDEPGLIPVPIPAPQQNHFGFAKLLEAARKQIRKIEASHLARISNKPGEFIPALEKFLEAHQERVQIILEPVMEFLKPESGGGVRAAADHCECLKAEWLDLAGSATPRNLKLLADAKLENWIETKANWEKVTWLN